MNHHEGKKNKQRQFCIEGGLKEDIYIPIYYYNLWIYIQSTRYPVIIICNSGILDYLYKKETPSVR